MAALEQTLTHEDLDQALKSKQLVAGFEPVIALGRLEACGAELHLAWQHPEFGPLAPSLFMPFVAAEGRSREITSFTLREAARAVSSWRFAGLDWTVSVNIPIEDLLDGSLPAAIGVLLDEFDLPAEALTIDIGESDLVRFSAQALPAITGLRALGCGVALDSAPGEAMIQDLRGLPFTAVKVSGAAIIQFVDRTRHSGAGRVAARVYNARSSGIPVTAVGIDNEAMLWSVQRLDLDAAQGSYICAPTDAFALMRWEKIWRAAADSIRDRKNLPKRPPARKAVAQRPAPAQPAEAEVSAPIVAPEIVAPEPEQHIEPVPPLVEEVPETFHAVEDTASVVVEPEAESEPGPELAPDRWSAPDSALESEPLPPVIEEQVVEEPVYLEAQDIVEEIAPFPVHHEPAAHAASAHVPADSAQAESTITLVPRRIPGIDKPIQMSVQNQGSDRFGFLKKLAKRA